MKKDLILVKRKYVQMIKTENHYFPVKAVNKQHLGMVKLSKEYFIMSDLKCFLYTFLSLHSNPYKHAYTKEHYKNMDTSLETNLVKTSDHCSIYAIKLLLEKSYQPFQL